MYYIDTTLILDKYLLNTIFFTISEYSAFIVHHFNYRSYIRMVRIIKQGEYTSTIYKLIADGDFKEASQILESGKRI